LARYPLRSILPFVKIASLFWPKLKKKLFILSKRVLVMAVGRKGGTVHHSRSHDHFLRQVDRHLRPKRPDLGTAPAPLPPERNRIRVARLDARDAVKNKATLPKKELPNEILRAWQKTGTLEGVSKVIRMPLEIMHVSFELPPRLNAMIESWKHDCLKKSMSVWEETAQLTPLERASKVAERLGIPLERLVWRKAIVAPPIRPILRSLESQFPSDRRKRN